MTAARRRAGILGGILVALGSFQFGAVIVLSKLATDGTLSAPRFLAFRFGGAAVLLGVGLTASGRPVRAAPGEGWRLALLGMVGYTANAGLFLAALRHGSAPAVALLFFTYPVMVAALAAAIGKGLPGGLVAAALFASLAGTALVAAGGGGADITRPGVVLALGAAMAFAMYLLGAEAVLRRTEAATGALWVSAAAAAVFAGWAMASGSARWPAGWGQWLPVAGSAAGTAGAFGCLFGGLRRIGALRTAVIGAVEPLSAGLLAAVFLGQQLHAAGMLGGVLILASSVAASIARGQSANG